MSKCTIKSLKRFRGLTPLPKLETGFSMLEAVVVVGVLLALAVGGFFAYGPITENAKLAKVRSAASEVHTGVLVASFDGDSNTEPQDVIDDWNSSTDKIKVEILESAVAPAMSATAATPSANEDYCVQATNVASPHIKATSGACSGVGSGGGSPDATPGAGDGSSGTIEEPPAQPETVYPTMGNIAAPVIKGVGTDLNFTVNILPGSANKTISTHTILTCMKPDRTTRKINTLTNVSTTWNGSDVRDAVASCGTDQLVAYTAKPLTEERLNEVDNKETFGGQTTEGVLAWDAVNGYQTFGNVSDPIIQDAGRLLSFTINTDSGHAYKSLSVQHEVSCMRDSDRTIREINGLSRITNNYNDGLAHTATVSCGADQIVGYTVKPLTLEGMREVESINQSGGYTATGELVWDSTNGYPTKAAISDPSADQRTVTFKLTPEPGNMYKVISVHYKLTCVSSVGVTRQVNALTSQSINWESIPVYDLTVGCGDDTLMAYSLQPTTRGALQEVASINNSGGYTATGVFEWTRP